MAEVTLKREEFLYAGKIGITRHVDDKIAGRKNKHGAGRGDEWGHDTIGSLGELAAAKYLGIYWNGNLGRLGAADVGNLEVRSCGEEGHSLILHKAQEGDNPGSIFIQAVVSEHLFPEVKLEGWIRARNGQKEKYWEDPVGGRPAYFVPSDLLNPMAEIWSQPELPWQQGETHAPGVDTVL